MAKCPVCGSETGGKPVCPVCGFDVTCDYGRFPTLDAGIPRDLKARALQRAEGVRKDSKKTEADFHAGPSMAFRDMNVKQWYHRFFTYYVMEHTTKRGLSGGFFAPNGGVTRAQMVTVLWNLEGRPVVNYTLRFTDVTDGSWCAGAIRWAASEGIVDGSGSGNFNPNGFITREQMATMLYRYEKKYGSGGFDGDWQYELPFKDAKKVSSWAYEAVAWCSMKGVIDSSEVYFCSTAVVRRSELAAVITRYLELNENAK